MEGVAHFLEKWNFSDIEKREFNTRGPLRMILIAAKASLVSNLALGFCALASEALPIFLFSLLRTAVCLLGISLLGDYENGLVDDEQRQVFGVSARIARISTIVTIASTPFLAVFSFSSKTFFTLLSLAPSTYCWYETWVTAENTENHLTGDEGVGEGALNRLTAGAPLAGALADLAAKFGNF